MVAERRELELAAASAAELAARRALRPLDSIAWLPLQWEFLSSDSRCRQIRGGNQFIGKSWAALCAVIMACLGRHPLGEGRAPVRAAPVEWWVVTASWSQSLAVQKKLWELLPKDELSPRTKFDEVNGFSPTKRPTVLFKNGSKILIKTTRQDTLQMSSATIDGALFDEPPKTQRMFTEVQQRLEERGGTLLLSYTPLNAPTGYLKELVETGIIEDHWRPLTPAELIPVGHQQPLKTADGRLKDSVWIAERAAKVSEYERPVVIHGDWEFRAVGRYFSCFRDGGQDSHVYDRLPECEVDLFLGCDHGSKPGKQIHLLMAVWRTPDGRVHIYVLDEYVDMPGTATPAMDAAGTIEMIGRHGFEWSDLTFAGGDRVHLPGKAEQKSNRDLQAQIAKILRVSPDVMHPKILTAKRGTGRGSGSVLTRSRWLFHRMLEPGGFGVHPRCTRLRKALNQYDLTDNEHKDPIDAIVYGVDPLIFGRVSVSSSPRVVVR